MPLVPEGFDPAEAWCNVCAFWDASPHALCGSCMRYPPTQLDPRADDPEQPKAWLWPTTSKAGYCGEFRRSATAVDVD